MAVTLFAQNLLESTVAFTLQPPPDATRPFARVYDRDQGPKYEWGGDNAWFLQVSFPLPVAQQILTVTTGVIDFGQVRTASALALVNHNLTGNILVYADDFTPPTTLVATIPVVAGVNVYAPFNETSERYWKFVFPQVDVSIGEMFLGVPRTVAINPALDRAGARPIGNVGRDRSRGGYLWSAKKGPARARLPWGWNGLTQDELDQIKLAYADCDEGAKKLIVVDEFDVIRWMDWMSEELDPTPVKGGPDDEDRLYELNILLEEAL